MSFDGKRLYPYGLAVQAEFEVRGDLVFRCGRAEPAVYQIRGDRLYEYGLATQAAFEIRNGRYVHEFGTAMQAVYELR